MGIFDKVKGQLLQSISYRSMNAKELAAMFDREGKRIMMGSVLTVLPGQAAVFVNEGQIADVFEPGRYELSTSNMPILTALKEWKFGFNESFIVEIIFVNTTEIIDVAWGTAERVTIKDDTFGLVNVGANGKYSFKITDPKAFVENLMGTKKYYLINDFKGFITPQISMYFKEIVTDQHLDFFDMQGYAYETSQILTKKSSDFFGNYGIELQKITVNVSLPQNVLDAINERAAMGALGGMEGYAYKKQVDAQAEAMVAMAKNPNAGGSVAGMGMQMAAGMQMGSMMQGQFMNHAPAQQAAVEMATCPNCGAKVKAGGKFCPECGKPMTPPKKTCVKCGAEISATAKFCPECGASQEAKKCPNCGAQLAPGAKFCPECGTSCN